MRDSKRHRLADCKGTQELARLKCPRLDKGSVRAWAFSGEDPYLILPALRTGPWGDDVCNVKDAGTLLFHCTSNSADRYLPFFRELPLGSRVSAENERVARNHGYMVSVQRVSCF